jgi:TolA-binding protein
MKRYRHDPNAPSHLRKLVESARWDDLGVDRRRRVAERLGVAAGGVTASNVGVEPGASTPPWASVGGIALTALALVGAGVGYVNARPSRSTNANPYHLSVAVASPEQPRIAEAAPPVATLTSVDVAMLPDVPTAQVSVTGRRAFIEPSADTKPPVGAQPSVAINQSVSTNTSDANKVDHSSSLSVLSKASAERASVASRRSAVSNSSVANSPSVASTPVVASKHSGTVTTSITGKALVASDPSTESKFVETKPSAEATSGSGDLRLELVELDGARRATESGRPSEALTRLDDYASKFPVGKLREEAMVLRIEALHASGDRTNAEKLARRFLRESPNTPYAARVRAALVSLSRE